ncbi:helix-turn-helix domain-containing protein [Polaromonas hydrogenivorans]
MFEVITLTGEGKSVSMVARQLGLSRAAIYRIQKCSSDAFASVLAWS